MIHENPDLCRLLIPEGVEFSHPDEARFYAEILRRTSTQKEYRRTRNPEYVPFSDRSFERNFSGSNRTFIRRLAHDSQYLTWNNSYSDGYTTARGDYIAPFTKSVILNPEYRTGRFQVVEVPKRRSLLVTRKDKELGSVGRALASRLDRVWLPENPKTEAGKPWHQLAIKRLLNTEPYSAMCNFGHRFHSNFTSMPGYLRNQLQASEPLVRIDISCAQPLFLGALALKALGPKHDVLDWISLCQYGMIYETISQGVRLPKEQTKLACVVGLFSTVEDFCQNPTFPWLCEHFPNVVAYILATKKTDHTLTAKLLQRAESLVMVHRVAKEYMKKFPGKPIITVHDEVIVAASCVEYTLKAITKAAKSFGVVPKTKTLEPVK